MSAEQQVKKEIIEAVIFLREKNHTIPSETIEFMKQASLEKLNATKVLKTYCFDCWDRNGKTFSKQIHSVSAEDAKILFEVKYPDLGYDEPFI
jgi:hypothetical protein